MLVEVLCCVDGSCSASSCCFWCWHRVGSGGDGGGSGGGDEGRTCAKVLALPQIKEAEGSISSYPQAPWFLARTLDRNLLHLIPNPLALL